MPLLEYGNVNRINLFESIAPAMLVSYALAKKKQLENASDMDTIEQLYAELDALEWLQRQVVKHIA